jgi:hypothetical protein
MSSAPSMSLIQQSLVACHRQALLHGSWRAPRCIVGRHALDGAAIKPAVTPEQSTPAVANVNGGRSLKHGTHQSLLPRQKRRPTSIWVSACKPRLAQPQRVPKRREVNHTQSAQLMRPCEPRPSDLALPAIAVSESVQMKALRNLSISLYIHGDTSTTMETWIGIAVRVTLVSVVRPTRDMNLDFHVGNLFATASTSSIRSPCFSM